VFWTSPRQLHRPWWVRSTPRDDRGSATAETVGTAVVTALVVASLLAVPVAPALGNELRTTLCRIGGQDCETASTLTGSDGGDDRAGDPADGDPADGNEPPLCRVATRDRSSAASGTILGIKLKGEDKVSVIAFGDGRARVIVSGPVTFGMEGILGGQIRTGERTPVGSSATGNMTTGYGMQLIYEFDDVEEAYAWAEQADPVRSQLIDLAATPISSGDMGEFARSVSDWLGFDPDVREPTAYGFELPTEAYAGAGLALELDSQNIRNNARLGAETSGKTNLVGEFYTDGSRRITYTTEAAGSIGNSVFGLPQLQHHLGLTEKVSYTLFVDPAGHAERLIINGESSRVDSERPSGATRPRAGGNSSGTRTGSGGRAGVIGEDGHLSTRTFILDLRNPTNREALENTPLSAFLRGGAEVVRADQQRPPEEGYAQLQERILADAVYVEAEYATTRNVAEFGARLGAGPGFAGEYATSDSEMHLVSALSQDLSVPTSELAPLGSCGQ
jgi:hypothetical protein